MSQRSQQPPGFVPEDTMAEMAVVQPTTPMSTEEYTTNSQELQQQDMDDVVEAQQQQHTPTSVVLSSPRAQPKLLLTAQQPQAGGLQDPGQHGIFNERQTNFCHVHDILAHMMRYLSAEEQLVLRRVNHTWQNAVDDLGSSKYTTQRVTRLVQEYNKAVKKEHEPKVKAHLYTFLLGFLTGLILFIFIATQYRFRDTTSTALVIISIICTPEIGLAGAIASFVYFRKDRLGHAIVLGTSLLLLTALVSASTWYGGKYYTGNLFRSSTIGVAECLFPNRGISSSGIGSHNNNTSSSPIRVGRHIYYNQILVLYPAMWSEECFFTTVEGGSGGDSTSRNTEDYLYSLMRVKSGRDTDLLAASIDCEEAMRDPLGYGTYYSLKVKSNQSDVSALLMETARTTKKTINSSTILSDDAAMEQVVAGNRFVLSGYSEPGSSTRGGGSSWGTVLSEKRNDQGAPVPTLFQAARDHLFWGTVDNHLIEKQFYKAKVWTEGQIPLVSTTTGQVDPSAAHVTFLCLVFAALTVWGHIVLVTSVRLIRRFIFFRNQLYTYPHERAFCKRPLTRRDAFLMIRRAQKNEEEAIQRAEERAAQLRARLRKAGLLQHSPAMRGTGSGIIPHPNSGPTTMPPLAARAPGGTVASMALGAAASSTAGGQGDPSTGGAAEAGVAGFGIFGTGRRQRIPGGSTRNQLHTSTPLSRTGADSPDSVGASGDETSVYAARDRVASALVLTPRDKHQDQRPEELSRTPASREPSTPYGFDMNDRDVAAYLQPSSSSQMARDPSTNYSFSE